MKNILCYGDSNTWGHNPTGYNPATGLYSRYTETERWPRVMETLLGDGYRVYEEGLCGRTTCYEDPTNYGWNGLTHYEVAFRTCDPVDCIIIMLGTNDLKDMFGSEPVLLGASMDRFLKNVYVTREFSLSKAAKVVVVNPASVQQASDGTYFYGVSEQSVKKAAAMKSVYRDLADKYGFEFFDADEIIGVSPVDGVHLTVEGHHKLAEALGDYVKKLIG